MDNRHVSRQQHADREFVTRRIADRTFDVPRDRAERDATEFLDRLADAGLVHPLTTPVA